MSLRGSLNDIFGMIGNEGLGKIGNFNQEAMGQNFLLSQQFSPMFQQLQLDMFQNDPLVKRMRQTAIKGLRGLQEGQLPADMLSNIEQQTARSQMARGIFDSPAANTEAVAALMGGSESIRASRLAQAGAVASQFSAPGQILPGGVPSFMDLLGAQQNTLGGRQEQANQSAAISRQFYGQLGSLAGSVAGGMFGGPMGAAAGGAMGGSLFGGGAQDASAMNWAMDPKSFGGFY